MVALASAVCAALAVWAWWIPARDRRARWVLGKSTPHMHCAEQVRASWRKRWWKKRQSNDVEVDVMRALIAELRTGQPPNGALCSAQAEHVAWPRSLRAAHWGADVSETLSEECPPLAACWQVNARTGAPLIPMIEQLVASRTEDARTRTALAAALAGPRATARMLALLPLIGIGLGTLLGTQPLAWLMGPGFPAFLLGGLLAAAGAWWTHSITRSVERQL